MQVDLKGRVALVTGAGSGIGKAAAVMFAEEDASVGVLDLKEQDVDRTVKQIEKAGGKALGLIADVSDPVQMKNSIDTLAAYYGRLDVVFANAGINGVWAPIEDLTPEEWDKTLAVNLKGTFLTVKYAVPHMKQRGGSVIVTSSVNGTRVYSNTGATAYSSSKAGQVAFTKMVALELAKHQIRVNVICPGAITTNIEESTEKRDLEEAREPVEFPEGAIPLTDGKPGTTEQVAQLVLFLASDAASHITGTEVWIDGGGSLLVA